MALTNFISHAEELIVPFTSDILRVFSLGFEKYQARNCHVLYDAVGSLSGAWCGAVHPAMCGCPLVPDRWCPLVPGVGVTVTRSLSSQRWLALSCKMRSGRACC